MLRAESTVHYNMNRVGVRDTFRERCGGAAREAARSVFVWRADRKARWGTRRAIRAAWRELRTRRRASLVARRTRAFGTGAATYIIRIHVNQSIYIL